MFTAVFVINQLNYLSVVDLPLQTLENGKKNLDSEKVKNFFTPSKTKDNQQSASGTLDSLHTASSDISSLDSTQKTVNSCFLNSVVTRAGLICVDS